MKAHSHFRTKIGRARGLGSAKHGVEHWWLTRLTALALIPLSVWLMVSMIRAMLFPSPVHVADWLASPISACMLASFVIFGFWHSKLGVQVIIEDYVKPPAAKYSLLLLNTFASFALAILSLVAILKLHLLDLVAPTL